MYLKIKRTAAIILSLILCLGCASGAIAAATPEQQTPAQDQTTEPQAPEPRVFIGTGTPENPVRVFIGMVLKVPVGTKLPKMAFRFELTPVSVDGIAYDGSNMPQIGKQVSNSAVDIDCEGVISTTYENAKRVGDIMHIPLHSEEIANKVSGAEYFEKPGLYIYKVTQAQAVYSSKGSTALYAYDKSKADITFSQAEYTLKLYVKQDGADMYLFAPPAIADVTDNESQNPGDKVDPTGDGVSNFGNMIFTNLYVKQGRYANPENVDATSQYHTLFVSRTTTGAYAYEKAYFNYKLSITAPSIVTDDSGTAGENDGKKTYKGYIVERSASIGDKAVAAADLTDPDKNAVYPPEAVKTNPSGQAYILFKSGDLYENGEAAPTFRLRNNQDLVFFDAQIGATYTVEEVKPVGYVPSLIINASKTAAVSAGSIAINGVQDSSISTGEQFVYDDNGSYVYFNNQRDEVSPTGVDLNDMPFVVMIALALIGVTASAAQIYARLKTAD